MKRRVRGIISGRVQGVFFRAHTLAQAQKLGVAGTVRNLLSGQVEVVAEGEESQIRALMDWCKQGPPMARVENTSWTDEPHRGEFSIFEIIS
jgi:acylphosphatase